MSEASRVLGDLEDHVEGLVKKVSITTTRMLFEATPELTGHAESNWVPVIGKPRSVPSGSRLKVDFNTQEAAIVLIDSTYKLPNKVYISNPVSYIGSLNAGSSAKAPSDFVPLTIAKSIKSIV